MRPYLVSPNVYLDARQPGWEPWERMGLIVYDQRVVIVQSDPIMDVVRGAIHAAEEPATART